MTGAPAARPAPATPGAYFGSRRRIVRQDGQRSPGRFAENVPPKPVGTRTSSPFGRSRKSVPSWAQRRPLPFVVVT